VNGAQRHGAVTTAPRDDNGEEFRFLVYGDNRSDDAAHESVVHAMETAHADFLVNTGDLVELGGAPGQWQRFFDIEGPLMRERPIFAVVGNHELAEGAGIEYVRYFGPEGAFPEPNATTFSLEQLSGTFRWANSRFFLVNGMVDFTSGPGRAWIEKVLGDADNEAGLVWRIVVVHHGPWSSGPHGPNRRLVEGKIPELFRAHKVDLVIAGHDHIYERGTGEGLPYLVSGGGGAPPYRIKKVDPTSRRSESAHHFIEASVSAAGIQLTAIRPDGSIIERCGLRKAGGWDCDGARSELDSKSTGAAGSTGAPAPTTRGSQGSRCGCRVAGADDRAQFPVGALFVVGLGAAIAGRRLARCSVR
jgi:predicted phosphodiesterase